MTYQRGDRVRITTDPTCERAWLHDDIETGAEGIVVALWTKAEVPDTPDHLIAVKSAGERYWQTSFSERELERVG